MNPAMWIPGPVEWAVIGVIGILVFGTRLPKVARGCAQSITEFKRGLKDVQGEYDETRDLLEDSQE